MTGRGSQEALGGGGTERPALPRPTLKKRRPRAIKGEGREPIDVEFRDRGDETNGPGERDGKDVK